MVSTQEQVKMVRVQYIYIFLITINTKMKIKSPRTKSIVNEGKIDMIKRVLTKILNKIDIKVEKNLFFFKISIFPNYI